MKPKTAEEKAKFPEKRKESKFIPISKEKNPNKKAKKKFDFKAMIAKKKNK